jgi:hypothetical protein
MAALNKRFRHQVRLYVRTHDQQLPGKKGPTALLTAAVVLALFAQVALLRAQESYSYLRFLWVLSM